MAPLGMSTSDFVMMIIFICVGAVFYFLVAVAFCLQCWGPFVMKPKYLGLERIKNDGGGMVLIVLLVFLGGALFPVVNIGALVFLMARGVVRAFVRWLAMDTCFGVKVRREKRDDGIELEEGASTRRLVSDAGTSTVSPSESLSCGK
jgi:hypothetical protein